MVDYENLTSTFSQTITKNLTLGPCYIKYDPLTNILMS